MGPVAHVLLHALLYLQVIVLAGTVGGLLHAAGTTLQATIGIPVFLAVSGCAVIRDLTRMRPRLPAAPDAVPRRRL